MSFTHTLRSPDGDEAIVVTPDGMHGSPSSLLAEVDLAIIQLGSDPAAYRPDALEQDLRTLAKLWGWSLTLDAGPDTTPEDAVQ